MLTFTLEHLIVLMRTYGYTIIFPLSIMEGPIVAVLSGFIASLGKLNIFFVFFTLLAGDIIGDTIHYIIGRWGRHSFIKKWGKYIGVTESKIQALEKYFAKHNWKILAFGKTQPIGSAILISA
ncbi:MAG: VTT domain-containing protein, partial [Candidatus Andersenbacteria bacterium]